MENYTYLRDFRSTNSGVKFWDFAYTRGTGVLYDGVGGNQILGT